MTSIVHGPRKSGKTTQLAQWARQNPDRIIVCFSSTEATLLRRKPHSVPRDQITTIHEVKRGSLAGWAGEIAIDNAEWALAEFFGLTTPPEMVAMTGEQAAPPPPPSEALPCSVCGQETIIPEGDYMCAPCRAQMD